MKRILILMLITLIFGAMVLVSCKKKNNQPEKPMIPSGPSSGSINVSYDFSSSADDPDGDSIAIRFSWGDGDTSEWSSFVQSGQTVLMSHSWSSADTYYIKTQAKDINGAFSTWSGFHSMVITPSGGNRPPNTPTIPTGPSNGRKDSLYTFAALTTDPDSDGIYYRFDWGGGDTSDWSAQVPNGYPVSMIHSWARAGTYSVKAQAKDGHEVISAWSGGRQIIINNPNPPNTPSTPSGDSAGFKNAFYSFFASATDPDGDSICYIFDWGDGRYDTSSFYPSGDSVAMSHAWSNSDTFYVKAKAEDEDGAFSDWSEGHQIIIMSGGEWTFGGTGNDWGYSVQPTSDGGYIITGLTNSYGAGGYDVYIIKTDALGNQVWYKTFGGIGYDLGYSVQETSDGGYIIAGSIWISYLREHDVCLIKTDADGNQQWEKTLGGTYYDGGYSVKQTSDGGYIIAGFTGSYGAGNEDVYLIKTDSSGNQTWDKTFGGTGNDRGYSVQPTPDGGYIIAGYTMSYGAGNEDVYLIKTDSSGNQTWDKTFGGTGKDMGYSVQPTSDEGYIIAGYTMSYGAGDEDVYLIKTDASGNQTWYKTLGGTSHDLGYSVQQTSDGGYIITGYTGSFGAGGDDVYLIKTDAYGNQTWYKTFGGTSLDYGYSVQQTSDGGYIITGYTHSFGAGGDDVYLIKTDAEGNTMKTFYFNPNRNHPNPSQSPSPKLPRELKNNKRIGER